MEVDRNGQPVYASLPADLSREEVLKRLVQIKQALARGAGRCPGKPGAPLPDGALTQGRFRTGDYAGNPDLARAFEYQASTAHLAARASITEISGIERTPGFEKFLTPWERRIAL